MIVDLVDLRLASEHEYAVSPRTVALFGQAVGETDPLCHSPRAAAAAGLSGVVAAPGFAFVVAYPLSIGIIGAAGIDPEQITHVAESQRLARPIIAGDVLGAVASVTSYREMAGGAGLLSWRVELTDAAGEIVGTTASTALVRPDGQWPERREPSVYSPPTDAAVHCRLPVTRGQVARYCGVSGDAHPVHWSDLAARRLSLGGVIMHGSLLLAVVGRAATKVAGGVSGVVELGARFAMPVEVPDDDVGCEVDVSAGQPDEAGRVALEVGVRGQRVLTAASAVVTSGSSPDRALPDTGPVREQRKQEYDAE